LNIDYSTVFSLAPLINEDIITLIGICFLIGAMAKSSQVGLHVWLPLAMEGPTPVSALIHKNEMRQLIYCVKEPNSGEALKL
jgi:NADH-ubiquinone oxidoreductase chain 5